MERALLTSEPGVPLREKTGRHIRTRVMDDFLSLNDNTMKTRQRFTGLLIVIPQRSNEGDLMIFYGDDDRGRNPYAVNLKTPALIQLSDDASRRRGEIVALSVVSFCGEDYFSASAG